MRFLYASPRSRVGFIIGLPGRLLRRALQRKVVCFAVALNLLIWPAPRLSIGAILNPVSETASIVGSAFKEVAVILNGLKVTPVLFVPSGPILIPVPIIRLWPFALGPAQQVRMADRIVRVSVIQISPHRMVGYIGEAVTSEQPPASHSDHRYEWQLHSNSVQDRDGFLGELLSSDGDQLCCGHAGPGDSIPL